MSVAYAAALARWRRSLELLARMPPEITANLINARLLADVAWLVRAEQNTAVQLRVVIVWAAAEPETLLTRELARDLADTVPGGRPMLAVVNLRSGIAASVVREQLAGAHAVIFVAGYYDLAGDEPDKEAAE